MATIELRLNSKKPNNYAFFCPVTRLHLTLANPVGTTDRVSNYILRGLKAKTLIDVKGIVDLTTGEINANVSKTKPVEEVKSEPTVAPVTQEVVEESPSQEVEAPVEASAEAEEVAVEEKKGNKRGKKVQA